MTNCLPRVGAALFLAIAASAALADSAPLFDFQAVTADDFAPTKLAGVKTDAPAPKVAIADNKLTITFDGGDWPVVVTKKMLVQDDWKAYQTLRATLTVDKPMVAYFRILQGTPDEKGKQPSWERTTILQKGANEMTYTIRTGTASAQILPKNGNITGFIIGAFQPETGQTLTVSNIQLSTEWPPPRTIGWYSPYNHDGYSSAVAREFERTGKAPQFQVLGSDLQVADIKDLAGKLKDKWVQPEAKTIEQVEADFRAKLESLKKDHPKAQLAIFREGEKGFDPANPDKAYAGWKFTYLNCHGPDGPNEGREKVRAKYETVEAFMRHRSPLLKADLTSIPKGSTILAARLVVTRVLAADMKVPQKPTMWVAEACSREWDDKAANCYFYAPGKLWKAVSGLYYGQDPDFHPVFLMHGPAGGGAVYDWDFTAGLKYLSEQENHGFMLYGDSSDYMQIYTPLAKRVGARPAILVIYEAK